MDEDIKKILEENLKLSKETHEMVKKIRSFVVWQQVFGVIKILLIVVPIILGLIYLPALLQNAFAPYKELLGTGQDAKDSIIKGLGIDEKKIPNEIIDKYLK